MHYEYIINVGKSEVIVQSTAELEEGVKVSLDVEPVNIQIMKKPFVSNFYDGYIPLLSIGEGAGYYQSRPLYTDADAGPGQFL